MKERGRDGEGGVGEAKSDAGPMGYTQVREFLERPLRPLRFLAALHPCADRTSHDQVVVDVRLGRRLVIC